MRQFSRAFVIEHKESGKKVVFVSIDVAMVSEALHKSASALSSLYHHLIDITNMYIHTDTGLDTEIRKM